MMVPIFGKGKTETLGPQIRENRFILLANHEPQRRREDPSRGNGLIHEGFLAAPSLARLSFSASLRRNVHDQSENVPNKKAPDFSLTTDPVGSLGEGLMNTKIKAASMPKKMKIAANHASHSLKRIRKNTRPHTRDHARKNGSIE